MPTNLTNPMRYRLLPLLFSLTWLTSCTYKNAEDLVPEDDPVPACDVSNVTYTATVAPILAQNCRRCHNATAPAANINLTDYTQVKRQADSGQLLGTINHAPGYDAMPLGAAKLADCDIARIKKWVDAGAPNN